LSVLIDPHVNVGSRGVTVMSLRSRILSLTSRSFEAVEGSTVERAHRCRRGEKNFERRRNREVCFVSGFERDLS